MKPKDKFAAILASVFFLFFSVYPLAYAVDFVNINTADKAELTTLYGIGEVKAQAIIDYRTQRGPFRKIEDLVQVKGIGVATFTAIKEKITVGTIEPLPEPPVLKPTTPSASPKNQDDEVVKPLLQPVLQKMVKSTDTESNTVLLVGYVLGLVAVITLGAATALYARATQGEAATDSPADEFEIIDAKE